MSLKNGSIGSPRTFVRTSDWLTDNDCGTSSPDDGPDSKIHVPEKSGLPCATSRAPSEVITTTTQVAVRRILSFIMMVSAAGVISEPVPRLLVLTLPQSADASSKPHTTRIVTNASLQDL